jgi:uncharacterized protein
LYMVLGTFAGFMSGLLGLGGGGILVPLLASIFIYQGMNIDNVVHLALGTSLTCMIISATASMRAHAARGSVEWQVVRGMAPGIIVGAFLASQFAVNIHPTYIAIFFALFMLLVAAQMFIKWQPTPSQKPISFRGLILTGAGIGSISALTAVGGGFLTVTYLIYKNVNMKRAIGTSAAIGLPIAIAGACGYMISGWSKTLNTPYTFGYIYVPAFLAISISSFIAVSYGARCSQRLPEAHLKIIFAIISLALSIKMLIQFI